MAVCLQSDSHVDAQDRIAFERKQVGILPPAALQFGTDFLPIRVAGRDEPAHEEIIGIRLCVRVIAKLDSGLVLIG